MWTVIVNQPGYLPEGDNTNGHDTYAEARGALCSEISETLQQRDPDSERYSDEDQLALENEVMATSEADARKWGITITVAGYAHNLNWVD